MGESSSSLGADLRRSGQEQEKEMYRTHFTVGEAQVGEALTLVENVGKDLRRR